MKKQAHKIVSGKTDLNNVSFFQMKANDFRVRDSAYGYKVVDTVRTTKRSAGTHSNGYRFDLVTTVTDRQFKVFSDWSAIEVTAH